MKEVDSIDEHLFTYPTHLITNKYSDDPVILWAFRTEEDLGNFISGLNSFLYNAMGEADFHRTGEGVFELNSLCDTIFRWEYLKEGDSGEWVETMDPSPDYFSRLGQLDVIKLLSDRFENETDPSQTQIKTYESVADRVKNKDSLARSIKRLGQALYKSPINKTSQPNYSANGNHDIPANHLQLPVEIETPTSSSQFISSDPTEQTKSTEESQISMLLGYSTSSKEQVYLNYDARKLGTYIIGVAGIGKTSTLLNLVMGDISSGHGLCAIDPQGKWIEDILARVPRKREKDIIYLDPSENNRPFGLHLFECASPDDDDTVDRVMSQVLKGVFEEIWGEMRTMPRMADVIRVACRTLIRCQSLDDDRLKPTLIEMPRLLRDDEYRGSICSYLRHRYHSREAELLRWWEGYEKKGGFSKDQQIASTLNKVEAFAQSAMVKRIVGQNKSTIDFREAMDDGKIILVDLAEGKVEREVASLIGALVISRIHIAAKSRVDILKQDKPLRRFHVLVDEFQNFATYAFAKLQDECRQYAVDITIAHQNRTGQLSGETQVQASTLGTTNWIVFRANPADADILASGFDTSPPEPELRGESLKYVLNTRPWNYIMSHGHENESVMLCADAIDRYLTVETNVWCPIGSEKSIFKGYDFPSDGALRIFINELNRFLYKAMKDKSDFPSLTQSIEVRRELNRLCDKIFAWEPGAPEGNWIRLNDISLDSSVNHDKDEVIKSIQDKIDQTESKWEKEHLLSLQWRLDMRRSVWEFISLLCWVLKTDPIWTIGGQPVADYDRPRLYTDVAAERSNQIKQLPKYEALCRLQEERHFTEKNISTIDTHKYWIRQEDDPSDRIKENSRNMYGNNFDDVLKMINLRYTKLPYEESLSDFEPIG
jgi:hypothetical protein